MKVLVDTSVWVRFLCGRSPYLGELRRLAHLSDVIGHELVYGELLMGDVGGRLNLLSEYQLIPWAERVPHFEVVRLVRSRRLHGRGAGWSAVHLLASALAGGHKLWTADPRLQVLAGELGCAYSEQS